MHSAAQSDDRDLYRIPEVAQRLGLREATIRKLVRAGRLPAVKLGSCVCVRAADYQTFLDALPARVPGREPAAATRSSLVRRKRRV